MKKMFDDPKNTSNDSQDTFKQKVVPNYLKLKIKIPFIFEITALWIKKDIEN